MSALGGQVAPSLPVPRLQWVPPEAATAGQPKGSVRFEKEVLRPGRYQVATGEWQVDGPLLRRLARNAVRARRWGFCPPVVWNHSADARDKLGEVNDLFVRGGALIARGWLADARIARSLASAKLSVSVEVREPWRDGQGRELDIVLTHVGVVTMPAFARQDPFRFPVTTEGVRSMSVVPEKAATPLEPPAPAGESASLAAVLSYLNALLVQAGAPPIALDVAPDELLARLQAALAGTPSSPAPESERARQLELELSETRRLLEVELDRRRADDRQAYLAACDRLVSEGRLTPADRSALVEMAGPVGYRMSLLAPYERLPKGAALPVTRVARLAASADPPAPAESTPMSADRARDIAGSFRR